jgi:hypothetical protein
MSIIIGGFSEDLDDYNYEVTGGDNTSKEDYSAIEPLIPTDMIPAWNYTIAHSKFLDRILGTTNYYMTCKICETNNSPPADSTELKAMFPHMNLPHNDLLSYLDKRTGFDKKLKAAKEQLAEAVLTKQKQSSSAFMLDDYIDSMGYLSDKRPTPPDVKLEFNVGNNLIANNDYAAVCKLEADLCTAYKAFERYYYCLILYLQAAYLYTKNEL